MKTWIPAIVAVIGLISNAYSMELGGSCQLGNTKRSTADIPTEYYECSDEDSKCNNIDLLLGCWQLKSCKKNETFSEVEQKCIDEKKRSRQQSLCQRSPSRMGCPPQTSCGGPITTLPAVDSGCNWMNAPLTASPNTVGDYMQCQRQTGDSCGKWRPQPCPMGSQFNPATQTCVQIAAQLTTSCGSNQAAVCGCAKSQLCPGTSQCNQGTCCQGINPTNLPVNRPVLSPVGPLPTIIASTAPQMIRPVIPVIPPRPVCPGTTVEAAGACGSGCSSGYGCRSGGCCPQSIVPQGLTIPIRPVLQPQPIMIPQPIMQPQPVFPPQPIMQPRPILSCPSGLPSQGTCAGGMGIGLRGELGCLPDQACFQGQCCPLPACPQTNQLATGFCSLGCPSNSRCFRGSCCLMSVQPVVPRPIMPIVPQVPRPNQVMCPGGNRGVPGACSQGCPQQSQCFRGGCCSQPSVARPQPIVLPQPIVQPRPIINPPQIVQPRPIFQPRPIVVPRPVRPPTSIQPTRPVVCPAGGQAIGGTCSGGCPQQSQCFRGGCCSQPIAQIQPIVQPRPIINPRQIVQPRPIIQPRPIAMVSNIACPSGLPSQGTCASGIAIGLGRVCPMNQDCFQGQCCPLPVCPQTNQIAIGFCSLGCPSNSQCYRGSCCAIRFVPQPIIQPQPIMRPQPVIQPRPIVVPRPVLPPTPIQPPRPVLCPAGSQTIRVTCDGGCPQQSQCFRGGCCQQLGSANIIRPRIPTPAIGISQQVSQYDNAGQYQTFAQPRPILEPRISSVIEPRIVSPVNAGIAQEYISGAQYANMVSPHSQLVQQVAPFVQQPGQSFFNNGIGQKYNNAVGPSGLAEQFTGQRLFNPYRQFDNGVAANMAQYNSQPVQQPFQSIAQPQYASNMAGASYGYETLADRGQNYDQTSMAASNYPGASVGINVLQSNSNFQPNQNYARNNPGK